MKYTKEMLEEAVKNSTSIVGVLRYLGKKPNVGSTHCYVKKKISEYDIDIGHFLGVRSNSGENYRGGNKPRTPDEVLVIRKDTREKSKILRKALIAIGREEKCEKCNIGNEWNSNSLTLQIDHKNGNVSDNRRENLRFICPNCHSQTPNHSIVKIRGRSFKYCKCGNKIDKNNKSGICFDCLSKRPKLKTKKSRPKKPRPTKIDWPDNLPKMVAESSKRSVAMKLGVSDKAIAKRLSVYHKV